MSKIDYTKKTNIWLYMNLLSDQKNIEAELDRRNNEAGKKIQKAMGNKPKVKKVNKLRMIDTQRETNRWYVDDSGKVVKVKY